MNSKMEQMVRKTRRYWYDDGFVEIGTGILLTLVALWLALRNIIPRESDWYPIATTGLPLLIMGAGIGGVVLIRRLKERITYPRTGYVSFDKNSNWRGWFAI